MTSRLVETSETIPSCAVFKVPHQPNKLNSLPFQVNGWTGGKVGSAACNARCPDALGMACRGSVRAMAAVDCFEDRMGPSPPKLFHGEAFCVHSQKDQGHRPPLHSQGPILGGYFSFFLLLPLTDPDPKMIPKKKEEFSFCAVFSGALV